LWVQTALNQFDGVAMFRLPRALASVAVTAVAAAVVIAVPVTPVAEAAATLFVGDYSTGDFSQWDSVQNRGYNGDAVRYVPTYSATVVDDPVKGKVARFEVRSGDVPDFGGGERSQVGGSATLPAAPRGRHAGMSFPPSSTRPFRRTTPIWAGG
jgi:hypothetical protein